MATTRQIHAARENIKKAQTAAKLKRSTEPLAQTPRSELAKQSALGRLHLGTSGRALEDRNRQQLYALAREAGISGRSAMGKSELIAAIRRTR